MKSVGGSVAAGRLSLATNQAHQSVTVSLDRPIPDGMAVSVTLGSPSGTIPCGVVTLNMASTDLVRDIPTASLQMMPLTYTTNGSRTLTGASIERRVVTYTLVTGA